MNATVDMKVKDLKDILNELPDDMDVIIPVISPDDANHISGFRHVRTAGILQCKDEDDALCVNAAAYGVDINAQVNAYDGKYIACKRILF